LSMNRQICRWLNKVSILAVSALFIHGCDSDDVAAIVEDVIPDPDPVIVTVGGDVTKGPVLGAVINVYAVDENGVKTGDPIATSVTDANGQYTIQLTDFEGVYIVEAFGGAYTDEATGRTKTIPEDSPLRAVSSIATGVEEDTTVTATVTPLTEIAVRIAEQRDGGLTTANVDDSNAEVGALFFGDTDDPAATLLNTRPADVTDSASAVLSDDERVYGLMLGAIATLQEDTGSLDEALDRLATDISDDGNLDESSADLSAASDEFIASEINNSGIQEPDRINDLLDAAAEGVDAVIALATGTDITQFSFDGVLRTEIDSQLHAVALLLPAGTDLAGLATPEIATSLGSAIAPVEGEDFSAAVEYQVTAEDGTTQIWVVETSVAESELSPLANITGAASSLIDAFVINNQRASVVGSVATPDDLEMLDGLAAASDLFAVSAGATIVSTSGSLAEGNAVFTVTAEDGESIVVWEVLLRVNEAQNQPAFTIGEARTATLLEQIIEFGADGGLPELPIVWSTSDDTIATIDATTGLVTLVSDGVVTITATKAESSTDLIDFLPVSASVELTVSKSMQTALAFADDAVEALVTETGSNDVSGGSGSGDLIYSSDDESVATVDADGVITAVGAGTATISVVKAGDDFFLESNTATLTITVSRMAQNEISFAQDLVRVAIGDTVPTNALSGGNGEGAVTYSSSDESIATVDGQGVVTPVAEGFTVISAVKAGDAVYLESNTVMYEFAVLAEQADDCVFDQAAWDECIVQ
jgi:hypothetical protein